MRNVLQKSCRENQNTHFMINNFFFRKSHRLWDNVEKCGGARGATSDVTIWRIRFACWKSKATCTYAHAHTHAPRYPHARTGQWVITFPRKQWFTNVPHCYLIRTLLVCFLFVYDNETLRKTEIFSSLFQNFSLPVTESKVLGITLFCDALKVYLRFSNYYGNRQWTFPLTTVMAEGQTVYCEVHHKY